MASGNPAKKKHHLLTVAAKSWIKTLKKLYNIKNAQMAYTNNCSEHTL